MAALKLFGFEIKRYEEDPKTVPSLVSKESDDGALTVAPAGAYGTYLDLDGSVRSEAALVNKYREMEQHQEVDSAVDDIVNEAIVMDSDEPIVTLNLDDTTFSDAIKDRIRVEFEHVLKTYRFNLNAYDIFRRWYVDGRLYYQVVIDTKNPKRGIIDLRYIDPRKIRKVREIKRGKDPATGISTIAFEQEYYLYNPKGFARTTGTQTYSGNAEGIKISKDSIVYVPSGLLDKTHTVVVSYLQKALKPLNNLRALEDSVVIYRISRAPERRIFYIDVGNLPKMKAEQYVQDIMTKFKNRIVYDSATGEVRDDRKFMTMLEDFWLPRREGGRGTEISTLPAGQNLGEMSDVEYFLRQLYKSLNVPVGRLESQSTFTLGRGTEITRDEDKFSRFITRLRLAFSRLLLDALERQLILKNVMRVEEWDFNSVNIRIRYAKDSYYSEIREAEIFQMRVETLQMLEPPGTAMVGKYFSKNYVQNKVMRMSEDDIKKMNMEIEQESSGELQAQVDGALQDLNTKVAVHKQAKKDGVILDPDSGNIMPKELIKRDATHTRD